MGIKKALTCFLMDRLPPEEQVRIVTDVIAWRFADLSPTEQRQRVEQFDPGLMHMMCAGRVGLPLLILRHLLRLSPSHWLARRAAETS